MMLGIADDYERLAQRAEQSSSSSDTIAPAETELGSSRIIPAVFMNPRLVSKTVG